MYISVCVYLSICIDIYVYICMCIYIYIYTYVWVELSARALKHQFRDIDLRGLQIKWPSDTPPVSRSNYDPSDWVVSPSTATRI